MLWSVEPAQTLEMCAECSKKKWGCQCDFRNCSQQKQDPAALEGKVSERAKRFELSVFSLGRKHVTTTPRPRDNDYMRQTPVVKGATARRLLVKPIFDLI